MNYYNEIKNELVNNEINRKVKNYSINKSDLNAYYNVGRMLSEAGNHYGEGIIEEYSKRLTYESPKTLAPVLTAENKAFFSFLPFLLYSRMKTAKALIPNANEQYIIPVAQS